MMRAAQVAWSVVAWAAITAVVGNTLAVKAGDAADPFTAAMLVFPVVGALVVTHQPRNGAGWSLVAIGVASGAFGTLSIYGTLGLTTLPWLPWGDVALALTAGSWVPFIGLMGTYPLLLFPDGRLPSPRWRPVAWFAGAALTTCYVGLTITPTPLDEFGFPDVMNPLGVDALATSMIHLTFLLPLVPLSIALCAAGLIQRFRRSRGVERQQMKWLAAAAGVTATVYAVIMLLPDPHPGQPAWMAVVQNVGVLTFFLIPAAIGVAILRYRLYDIDVIINRALAYGVLTTGMTLTYLAVVTVLQALLRPIAGQSDLAVAASTLVVAGLFQPARTRVRAGIDRRFYRSKYDAGRAVAAFAMRVRDDVNVEALQRDLVASIRGVVHPAHLTVWLRDGQRAR